MCFVCSFDHAFKKHLKKKTKQNKTHKKESEETIGLILLMIASCLSGLAGTLVQYACQKTNNPRNAYVFSAELAIYSFIFLASLYTFTTHTHTHTIIINVNCQSFLFAGFLSQECMQAKCKKKIGF